MNTTEINPQNSRPPQGFNFPFWQNLSIRWKLTLVIILAAGIPAVLITQANAQFARTSYLESLKTTLKEKGKYFATDFVQWGLNESQVDAKSIASSVQGFGIDLSDRNQVAKNKNALQSLLQISNKGVDPTSIKSFKLITDLNGRTVGQVILTVDQDFSVNPQLASSPEIPFKALTLPEGIPMAELAIVKQSLSSGESKNGTEIIQSSLLKSLGLANQAAIAPRPQVTQSERSSESATVGTFDLEQGKAGIANISVTPIKVNGKVVGSAIVGTLLNRYYGIPDAFRRLFNVPLSSIYAQDFQVSTNVPYVDPNSKKPDGTRAFGTRVPSEVAESVLKNRQNFVGEANIAGANYLTYYQPLLNSQNQPIGISFIATSLAEVESNLNNLLLQSYAIALGSLILIGFLAGILAEAITKPLTELSNFSKQIGKGNFSAYTVQNSGKDEIGILNTEISKMASGIQSNSQSSNLQLEIVDRAKISQDISQIFDLVLTGAKQILGADRVVVYKFNEDGGGTIVAEAVNDGLPKALNDKIEDACISQELIEAYKKGRVVPTRDVFNAGFHPDHLDLMKRLTIKSNLVTPIVTEEKLLGLLIAHFCYDTHDWQEIEVSILRQLALQLGLAIERVNFLQAQKSESDQQKQQKENLQQRAMELLIAVDPISRGDLTVRAQVTEDEIGTVADSYNATVTSLRGIVSQVQTASQQVLTTTGDSSISIQSLSDEALRQSKEVTAALAELAKMASSIAMVATTAEKAEAAVNEANATVKEGEAAMDRTVQEFLAIRNTVAETAEKVEQLGESSLKISQVVNLIGSFAAQTNILALNASMEAARAGEEGRGFAVVADEVRSLARQSAKATNEIEKMVVDIQAQTKALATSMQIGAKQVATGTQIVDTARQSLDKISIVSGQINSLVEAIATATITQSQASMSVTKTMNNVAAIADNTSGEAIHVADGFKQLLLLAQQLQSSVQRFKVS